MTKPVNPGHAVQILENCISCSIQCEFDRAMAELMASESLLKDGNRISSIAACCSEILDEEVACFSPLFSSHVKMPAEVAAIEVHRCFNSHLIPFLQTGKQAKLKSPKVPQTRKPNTAPTAFLALEFKAMHLFCTH